jgi:hypothetical protein
MQDQSEKSADTRWRWLLGTLIALVVALTGVFTAYHSVQAHEEDRIDNHSAAKASAAAASASASAAAEASQLQRYENAITALDGSGSAGRLNGLTELFEFGANYPGYRNRVVNQLAARIRAWSPDPVEGWHPYGSHSDEVLQALGKLRTLLQRIDPEGTNYKIDLSNTNIHGVSLNDLRFAGDFAPRLDARAANLTRAKMNHATLTGATFECAELSDAQLKDAVIARANFRHADLTGANMRVASRLDWGDPQTRDLFVGASWNDETQWPDGVPPPFASAIHHGHACARRLVAEARLQGLVSDSPAPSPMSPSPTATIDGP